MNLKEIKRWLRCDHTHLYSTGLDVLICFHCGRIKGHLGDHKFEDHIGTVKWDKNGGETKVKDNV